MTWTEMADAVAHEFGIGLSEAEADLLLWNVTGFPSFWRTGDPIMECSNQLRRHFRGQGYRRLRPLRAYSKRLAGATA